MIKEIKHDFKENPYKFYLFAAFIIWCVAGLFFHELWRDEAQAYLIVRDCSLSETIGRLKTEGHPILWFLLNYPFVKLGMGVWSLKILSVSFAIGACYMVCFKLRVNNFYRLLFVLFTPLLFQYGIVARSYSVGLFFALLALGYYHKRNDNKSFFMYGLSLAVMCQVSVSFAVIAGAFIAMDILHALFDKRLTLLLSSYTFWINFLLFAVSAFVMLYMVAPGSYYEEYQELSTGFSAFTDVLGTEYTLSPLGFTVSFIAVLGVLFGWFPLAMHTYAVTVLTVLSGIFSYIVFVLVFIMLLKMNNEKWRSGAVLYFTVFVFAFVLLTMFTQKLWVQHTGVFYVALIIVLTLTYRDKANDIDKSTVTGYSPDKKGYKFVVATFAVMIMGLVFQPVLALQDVFTAYGDAVNTAEFIKTNGYDNDKTLIYTYDEVFCAGIIANLENINTFTSPRGEFSYVKYEGLEKYTQADIDYGAIVEKYGDKYDNILLIVYYVRADYDELCKVWLPAEEMGRIYGYGGFIAPSEPIYSSPKEINQAEESFYIYKLK